MKLLVRRFFIKYHNKLLRKLPFDIFKHTNCKTAFYYYILWTGLICLMYRTAMFLCNLNWMILIVYWVFLRVSWTNLVLSGMVDFVYCCMGLPNDNKIVLYLFIYRNNWYIFIIFFLIVFFTTHLYQCLFIKLVNFLAAGDSLVSGGRSVSPDGIIPWRVWGGVPTLPAVDVLPGGARCCILWTPYWLGHENSDRVLSAWPRLLCRVSVYSVPVQDTLRLLSSGTTRLCPVCHRLSTFACWRSVRRFES